LSFYSFMHVKGSVKHVTEFGTMVMRLLNEQDEYEFLFRRLTD